MPSTISDGTVKAEIPTDQPTPYDRFTLFPTDALWAWWRNVDTPPATPAISLPDTRPIQSSLVPNSASEAWNPAANAAHRLIQWIDIFIVSVTRYQQITMERPFFRGSATDYDSEKRNAALEKLHGEYRAVALCLFGHGVPGNIVGELADAAVAQFVKLGRPDAERWIRRAAAWLGQRWHAPASAEPVKNDSRENYFQKEQDEVLDIELTVRPNLFAELSRAGQTVPSVIRDRVILASKRIPPHATGQDIIEVNELIDWSEETRHRSDEAESARPGIQVLSKSMQSVTLSEKPDYRINFTSDTPNDATGKATETAKTSGLAMSITDRLILNAAGGREEIERLRAILEDRDMTLNEKLKAAADAGLIEHGRQTSKELADIFGFNDGTIRQQPWWKSFESNKPKVNDRRRRPRKRSSDDS